MAVLNIQVCLLSVSASFFSIGIVTMLLMMIMMMITNDDEDGGND